MNDDRRKTGPVSMPRAARAGGDGRPAPHLLLERRPVTMLLGTAAVCALLRWDTRIDREINDRSSGTRPNRHTTRRRRIPKRDE